MNKPRIVFFGTPEFAVKILETLVDMQCNVVASVSQPDKPVGRKHIITPTPVHAFSEAHGIPCVQPDRLSKDITCVTQYEPDFILTCAYGQLVPESILNYPKLGCLNIHPSLLPKYRGGAPIQHALLNGDTKTGVSLMQMTKEMDAGKVYVQKVVDIDPDETMSELSEKLNVVSCQLLRDHLQEYIDGKLPGIEQEETGVIIAPTISKQQEEVHFHLEDIDEIYNHIRALLDWPVAFGTLEGKRIKFYKVRKEIGEVDAKVGTILGFTNHAFQVACMGGVLHIYELQMEGKKRMQADAFYNGQGKEVIGKVFE